MDRKWKYENTKNNTLQVDSLHEIQEPKAVEK